MITLFGATGYTGRLVAAALARRGLAFRLAGRSPERLAALSQSLPDSPPWLVADATRPETLSALLPDTRLLVNCAGPFTDLGEPVVALAALSGVHYLDTSNELGYVHGLRSYDALAQGSGAAIVPACGFEVALADCAAAVLAASMEAAPTEIDVVYDLGGGGSSIGTRRSAVRSLATSWLAYRQGRWLTQVPCREVRPFHLPGRRRHALSFPSSEIATVPGHLAVQEVRAWMAISAGARFWAPLLLPFFARLARGPVGRLVEAVVVRVARPPRTGMRSQAPFAVRVEVHHVEARAALMLTGRGVYELTSRIVAYAAGQMLQPGYHRRGVLAPAAALDPQAMLARAAAEWGVQVSRDA